MQNATFVGALNSEALAAHRHKTAVYCRKKVVQRLRANEGSPQGYICLQYILLRLQAACEKELAFLRPLSKNVRSDNCNKMKNEKVLKML